MPLGFTPLDKTIGGGLRAGELLLIGGAQGTGKTTMAVQMARNIVMGGQASVLYVCFEHDEEYLLNRIIAMESALPHLPGRADGVKLQDVRKEILGTWLAQGGELRRPDRPTPACGRPSSASTATARTCSCCAARRPRARSRTCTSWSQRYKELSGDRRLVVFIDYMQKVPVIPSRRPRPRRSPTWSTASRTWRSRWRCRMISIVAADKEGLKASRLRNHHLRGSSAINYEADIILILNEKYQIVAKVNIEFNPYQAQRFRDWVVVTVEKNRGGQNAVDLEYREALRVLLLRRQRAHGPGEAHRGAPLQRLTALLQEGPARASRPAALRRADRLGAMSASEPGRAPLPMRPSVVLLDVGDTMVRPDPSWRDVYATVFAGHGIEATAEQFEAAFREAWKEWEHGGPVRGQRGGLLPAPHGARPARLRPPRLSGPAGVASSATSTWPSGGARRSTCSRTSSPPCEAMRAAGLRLAVVSNWGWAAPELLQTLELAQHFEVLSISARVGYQKPHPAIFEHALELLGVDAREAVHVGDDPQADVVGARRAGIEPVLIDRHGRAHPPIGADAPADGVTVIADLAELLDLLGIARPAELAGAAQLSAALPARGPRRPTAGGSSSPCRCRLRRAAPSGRSWHRTASAIAPPAGCPGRPGTSRCCSSAPSRPSASGTRGARGPRCGERVDLLCRRLAAEAAASDTARPWPGCRCGEGAGRVIELAGRWRMDCPARPSTSGPLARRTPSAHLTVARSADRAVVVTWPPSAGAVPRHAGGRTA